MRDRVLTSSVLIPSVLAVLFLTNPWPLAALGLLIWILCTIESNALLSPRSAIRPITYVCYPLIAWYVISAPSPQASAILGACALAGIACTYFAASQSVAKLVTDDLASLWYSAPLGCCLLLHGLGSCPTVWSFQSPLLLALVPVWSGDVAGIFAGQAFGKHPLAPHLSPKKTIEGAVANLLASGLVGALVGLATGRTLGVSLACGLAAGLLGQLGDLFESYIKRRAGVKDSGLILPGHGGILDRIDSLLFTAPVVSLILAYFR